jgi:hypothetical protein
MEFHELELRVPAYGSMHILRHDVSVEAGELPHKLQGKERSVRRRIPLDKY